MTATEAIAPRLPLARPKLGLVAALLFVSLWALYQVSGTVLDEGDAVPSAALSVALLKTGHLSFDPEHFPEMFKWKSLPPFYEKDDFFFTRWTEPVGDLSAREWHERGKLVFNGPRYYVVESKLRHTYVSTFGPIPGLVLFPFIAPFYALDPGIGGKLALRATVARIGAAAIVASVAVLILLIAARFTTRRRALLLAVTYGIGTCAWAISSQNIWQQTVTQLFLTLGAYYLVHPDEEVVRPRAALLAGLFLGAATASRATCAAVVVTVLAYLFLRKRQPTEAGNTTNVIAFVAGVLPLPIAVAIYNYHFFGSPFVFAQELIGHAIAKEKTGSPELWQTPLWLGAAGLLFSPSRGLLVFSPVLAPSFAGVFQMFRNRRFVAMRPLAIAALSMMTVQCRWFDWWGGHAYGYRPWLDVVPFLVLFMVPLTDALVRTRPRRVAYGVVLGWCALVQALGALSYDRSWNLRNIFVVRVPTSAQAISFLDEASARKYAEGHHGIYLGNSWCDIDLWFCRQRLWSLEDNVIEYQWSNFKEARSRRLPAGFAELGTTDPER